MTIQQRKSMIENVISKVAGFAIELTIISEKKFSMCCEGCKDFGKVVSWLKDQAAYNIVKTETIYDDELCETFFYFDIA